MSMNAQQIADTINAGNGPEGLFTDGNTISDLAERQRKVEGRIKALQDRMERSWQGKGADAARAGAGPLKQAAQQANEHMGKASGLYEEQGDSFNTVKAKIGSGPGPKPDKHTKPPTSFRGPQTTNQSEIDAWHDEADRIVDEYNKYQDSSMKNSNSWPDDYGRLGLPEGGNDFAVNMSGGSHGGDDDNVQHIADSGGGRRFGPGGPPGSGTPGSNTGPSSDGAGPANHHVSGPGTGSASGDLHSRGDVPAAGDTSTGSAGYTSPGGASGNTPGSSGYPGTSGYPGGNTGSGQHFGPGGSHSPGGSGAGNAFGPVGPGGHSGSGAPGSGSSSGYGPGGSGAGTRGVPGSTGSGAGSGSGGGSGSPGAGRSSGVGAPREGAAPVRGAGSAATGSGGGQTGGGRGMMPGMGGAGRGQGGDEEEHERPSYLEEPDADELFGPDPNDKTVPPVIGL